MAIIGVLPLVDRERESYWMLPGYLDGVLEAGGVPVMLPLTEDPAVLARLVEQCDGFLFTGGHDIDPAVYGAARLPQCGECCPARDRMETALLPMALAPDGLVEAVYLPEKPFVWGGQWHPEFSHRTDENSRKIFRAFVVAAEGNL